MNMDILAVWGRFYSVLEPYLTPIESEAQYETALELVERLWGEAEQHPESPYGRLFATLTRNIAVYEAVTYPVPDAAPRELLRFLMDQHDLSQKDLEHAVGIFQGNLSQILSGARNLTTDQIRRLAAYFKVDPGAFI